MRTRSKAVAALASGLAVAAGGTGAALATSQSGAAATDQQTFLNDVAGRLGVSESKLSEALKAAQTDQVDAALASGRITQAQADAMKPAIQSGAAPVFGVFGARGGPPPFLDAAASYLGLTAGELRGDLDGGKTLAELAKTAGKSVTGLESAIEAEVKAQLDNQVASGTITSAREQDMLSELSAHLDDIVNGTRPAGPGPGVLIGPGA